jgi:hypothetical protein
MNWYQLKTGINASHSKYVVNGNTWVKLSSIVTIEPSPSTGFRSRILLNGGGGHDCFETVEQWKEMLIDGPARNEPDFTTRNL